MFGSIGWQEILVILVIALLVFGPRRLPELGHTLGKALSEFRRATSDLKRTLNAELALDEEERTRAPRRPELAPPEPRVRPRATDPPAGTATTGTTEPAEIAAPTPAVPPASAPPATLARGAAEPEAAEPAAEGAASPGAEEPAPAATH